MRSYKIATTRESAHARTPRPTRYQADFQAQHKKATEAWADFADDYDELLRLENYTLCATGHIADSRVECTLGGAECESVVHVLWECSSYSNCKDNFQEALKQLRADFETLSAVLGSENWVDDLDALLHLVKEFIVDVWEVQKQKLYGGHSQGGGKGGNCPPLFPGKAQHFERGRHIYTQAQHLPFTTGGSRIACLLPLAVGLVFKRSIAASAVF